MSNETDAKAIVYLNRAGNHRNKALLFENHLMLIYRGKSQVFRLEDIGNLYFTRQKILIPIILGGITASFSIVAMFVYYSSPILIISIFVAGVLIMYLGYNGEDVLVIDLKVKQEYFPLRSISDNLKAFVHFLNKYIKAGGNPEYWYIYLPIKSYFGGDISFPDYPVQAYTFEQMQKQRLNFEQKFDKSFVALNPFLLKSEVRYESRENSKHLFPMIYGYINQEAIAK